MSKGLSLNEFASADTRQICGVTPWIESISEWPEVLEAFKAGVRQYQIREWLITERGYLPTDATRNRVAHLARNHKHG